MSVSNISGIQPGGVIVHVTPTTLGTTIYNPPFRAIRTVNSGILVVVDIGGNVVDLNFAASETRPVVVSQVLSSGVGGPYSSNPGGTLTTTITGQIEGIT